MKNSIFNRKPISIYLPVILIAFIFLFETNIISAETNKTKTKIEEQRAPLHVISDKMIATKDKSLIEFIGKVKATRLDSIVIADSLKVYFNESSSNTTNSSENNVKKIVATGNVEYTMEDRKAYSDMAVYTTADEILILTGKSPKLVTGKNFVTGKKITLYRLQDKVIVESDGKKRVEAMFNPEEDSAQK